MNTKCSVLSGFPASMHNTTLLLDEYFHWKSARFWPDRSCGAERNAAIGDQHKKARQPRKVEWSTRSYQAYM